MANVATHSVATKVMPYCRGCMMYVDRIHRYSEGPWHCSACNTKVEFTLRFNEADMDVKQCRNERGWVDYTEEIR